MLGPALSGKGLLFEQQLQSDFRTVITDLVRAHTCHSGHGLLKTRLEPAPVIRG